MKINIETRFIFFLFMLSIACMVTLNLNTNSKISRTDSLNNKFKLNLLNLLELKTNSNLLAENKNKVEFNNNSEIAVHLESDTFYSSSNHGKMHDDDSSLNFQSNESNQENVESDGSENLITDLQPEERAQAESTATITSEAKTKDPLRSRNQKRFKLTTKKTSTDKGNILKLAEFDVRCPVGEVLSGYHMWGESNHFSSNQIGIEYNCVKIPNFNTRSTKPFIKVSKLFEVKGDVKDALLIISKKDLNIECPDGKLLSHFNYVADSNKRLGLQTTCLDAKVKDCKSVFTKEENIRTYNNFGRCINQYSQFFIEAEPGKVLQKVRHFKVDEEKMKVYVTSCSLDLTNSEEQKKKEEEEKKKKEEEEKKKKEEEEKKKKEEEEKKKILEAKKIDDEKKAKQLKEQKDILKQQVTKVLNKKNEKVQQIENSKAVINNLVSTIADNELKKQQEINGAKKAEIKGALLQDNQKKILADKDKALINMNLAIEQKKINKKEEERFLNKLLTLKEKLKKEIDDINSLKEENKKLDSDKIDKEKLILNSKSDAEKRKFRDDIQNIVNRINEIQKKLNPKKQTKLQTELDIKYLEKRLNNNNHKTHEIINKEFEARKEIGKSDDQLKNIQEQIKENTKIEDKLKKDIQDIVAKDKKLEQQLNLEKNKEKKLTEEEIKTKMEAEKLKNEAEKKQEEEMKVKENLEQTNKQISNENALLSLNQINTPNSNNSISPSQNQNKIIQNPLSNNNSKTNQTKPLNNLVGQRETRNPFSLNSKRLGGLKNFLNTNPNTTPSNNQPDNKAPLPSVIRQQIQNNKDTVQGTAVGNNLEVEKIDKNLTNKNAFCAKNCFDDNQNTLNPKKCYLNGLIKNCFSCKIREAPKTEREKNIEKLCLNFCNHVENTPSCLYFGYINKNKKQIDIDPKILIELGIKKSNMKLRYTK